MKTYKDFAKEREEAEQENPAPVILFIVGLVFGFDAMGYILGVFYSV